MASIYGLAVILIIFEGIIIQCQQLIFPNNLIENFANDLNLKTDEFERFPQQRKTDIIISKILPDYIITIEQSEEDDRDDFYKGHGEDDSFLRICDHRKIMAFFKKYAGQVKKIDIAYSSKDDKVLHKEINLNIIKACANHLEELRFECSFDGDEGFWEEISEGKNDFKFPEVTKFQSLGPSTRKEFDLKSIFPKLQKLRLSQTVADKNCMANLESLEELWLDVSSIEEYKLDNVFAKNTKLNNIFLVEPQRMETVESIAKHSTKLKTLGIDYPGEVFKTGRLSFDAPKPKKLILSNFSTIDQIINFIKCFKELEEVFIFFQRPYDLERIRELQHIREIKITIYEVKAESVIELIESFPANCELQTLKFLYFLKWNTERHYKFQMNEIDSYLKKKKSTWTLSKDSNEPWTTGKNFVFKRKPCKK